MNFLYPYFNTNTHKISGSLGVSIEYPNSKEFDTIRDYPTIISNIPEVPVEDPNVSLDGVRVCVIREHTGYKSRWSLVKVIDPEYQVKEYYNKEFYVLTKKLINIGSKETYTYNNTDFSEENRSAAQINPALKEIFIPYIDKYNGFYSVRIQVGYEKILDMKLFKKLIEQVYQEGISILLAGRGYSSSNETVTRLSQKYYTFGFVQNDLDLTKRRMCEPITFTVSMPLNFFDSLASNRPPASIPTNIKNTFIFTNKDFVTKIDNIMLMLSEKDKNLEKELFPNKRLSNYFGISSELIFIKDFAVALSDVMASVECPISTNEPLTTYRIGLDSDNNIIYVNIKKQNENNTQEITFNEGLLTACRMNGDISNKRVLNYFVDYQNMLTDYQILKSIDFFIAHSKFPPVLFEDDNITINGQNFTPEKVKEFRMSIAKNSEQCFSGQQGVEAVSDIYQLFSDPAFHVFAAFDPKNTPSFDSITKQINKNFEFLQKNYNQNVSKLWWPMKPIMNLAYSFHRTGEEIFQSDTFSAIDDPFNKSGNFWAPKDKDGKIDGAAFFTNMNYILKRVKIEEIILKAILCNLKGTPANDPIVRELLSKIPDTIINFFLKWSQTNNLSGAAYVAFIESGASLTSSFCTPDELVLVLKTIAKLAKGINTFSRNTVNYIKEIDSIVSQYPSQSLSGKAYNPYKAIFTSVVNTIYTTIIDITFDYAKDALKSICDDDLYLDQTDNFSSPLGTHARVQSQDGINNDPNILKANIGNSLDQSLPSQIREMRFGSDLDYTIDLISLLIEDIKCILSPREGIDLLKGEPSEEVIVIIKNIIRSKYSKDPNNLSYLLNSEKIKMFFKKLGLTVDNNLMNQVSVMIPEVTPGDLCTPEQLKYREDIKNNSFPAEIGTLQQDTRARIERAKSLFEKLDSAQPIKNISALCPDNENAEIDKLKADIVKQYMDSIRSMFFSTLASFTDEAASLSQNLSEEKVLTRKDASGTVFESFKYNNFYSNLGKNLTKYQSDPDATYDFIQTKLSKNTSYFKTLYKNYNSSPIPKWQLEDMFLKTEIAKNMVVQDDKCSSGSYTFQSDEMFKKFLSEGRVIWENRPYSRLWDNIDKDFSSRGGAATWESKFSYELRTQQPELYNYIKEKEYVLFISSEIDFERNVEIKNDFLKDSNIVPLLYKFVVLSEAGIFDRNLLSNINKYNNFGLDNPIVYFSNKPERIHFRLIRYSSPEDFTDNQTSVYGDFKLLASSEVEDIDNTGEVLSDEEKFNRINRRKNFRINFSNYTGEIISNLQYDRTIGANRGDLIHTDEKFYSNYYPSIRVFERATEDSIFDIGDRKRYSAYIINEKFLDIINTKETLDGAEFKTIQGYSVPIGFYGTIETLNIFQKLFSDIFRPKIEEINKFDLLFRSTEKFQKNGIFNIVTTVNNNNSYITKNIFIPGSLEENDLDYVQYYGVSFKKNITKDVPVEIHIISKLLYDFVYLSLNDITQVKLTDKIRSWQTLLLSETQKIENIIQQQINQQKFSQISQNEMTNLGLEVDRRYFESGLMSLNVTNPLDMLNKKTYIKDIEINVENEQAIIENESYKLIPEVVFKKGTEIIKIQSLIDFELSVKAPEVKMNKNMDYQDPYAYNYSKYNKLDMSKNLRYKNCDLYPHYLNLDYFINAVSIGATDKLCDSNLSEVPKDVLREIIYNITIRANVTDIMVKLIPLLSLFSYEEILNIHKKQEVIDIIRAHMAREMSLHTSNLSIKDASNYYNLFTSSMYNFYADNKNVLKINDKFKLSSSAEENIYLDALISREIKHFINFCIDNTVFYPSDVSLIDQVIELINKNISIEDKEIIEYTIWIEIYGLMMYFLMANTVDADKKALFSKTKTELFNLFYNSASIVGIEGAQIQQKSEEDIIKYINNLSNVSNPSALIYSAPQYSKYVDFFIKASSQQAKSILGTVALQTETNMFFTKLIQTTLGYATNTTWLLLDEAYRNKFLMESYIKYYKDKDFNSLMPSINGESAYTIKRISEGKAPLSDWMVSTALSLGGIFAPNLLPGVYTLAYNFIDYLEYADWKIKSHEEIKKTVEGFLAGKDVCQVNTKDINSSTSCADTYESLVSEINKYEEI